MEMKELSQEEKNSIYGGNELSESLLYYAGVIAKGITYFASGAKDGGYSYCKCGI